MWALRMQLYMNGVRHLVVEFRHQKIHVEMRLGFVLKMHN